VCILTNSRFWYLHVNQTRLMVRREFGEINTGAGHWSKLSTENSGTGKTDVCDR
jgi:hypothetical protein